jgi:hypothetical protein
MKISHLNIKKKKKRIEMVVQKKNRNDFETLKK